MNGRAALHALAIISFAGAGLVLGFGYLTRVPAGQCAQINAVTAGSCSGNISGGFIAVAVALAVVAVALFAVAHLPK